MIKRLLVCFSFALCSILWGEGVSVPIVGEVQELEASKAVQKEVGKMTEASQSIASPEELEAFEKLALTDPNRALELSMYYQGWGKDECFYVFDDEKSESPITRTYVKDSELTRQLKMRDFDKALKFAELAFSIIPVKEKYKHSPIDEKLKGIKKKVDLNLMKLYILRGEEFAEETFNFFVEKVASHNFEKEGKLYGDDLYRKFDGPPSWAFKYKELHVYFYSKGFGVKKDIQFAKDLLHQVTGNENWRAFYLPKYYIKDFEFVKFLIAEGSDPMINNHFLYLIYSGKFNEEEKDEVLAKQYFDIYEETLNRRIESDTIGRLNGIKSFVKHPKYSLKKYSVNIMRLYLEKYFFYGILYDKILLIPNPYYNIELAKKYMKNLDPYLAWKCFFLTLPYGYSIKDYKKYTDEIEKNKDLTQEQKDEFKDRFIGVYNVKKRDICENPYSDRVKIDFDNL